MCNLKSLETAALGSHTADEHQGNEAAARADRLAPLLTAVKSILSRDSHPLLPFLMGEVNRIIIVK